MQSNPSEVVEHYLSAFYTGDHDAARQVVADGLRFRGPFVQVDGKDNYFEAAQYLRSIVRDHQLLHRWADEGEVCSVFELNLETDAGTGTVLLSEWHTVEEGQIIETRLIFDTAAFRAVVPDR